MGIVKKRIFAVLAGGVAACIVAVVAAPKLKPFALPVGTYRDFALAKDARSLDAKAPMNALFLKQGLGRPVKLLKTGDGFAVVRADSLNATLKVPLGWTAIESREDFKMWTPGMRTLVTMQFYDALHGSPIVVRATPRMFFAEARKSLRALAQSTVKPGVSKMREFTLADGSYGVEVSNGVSNEGYPDDKTRNAYVQLLTPNPKNPRRPLLLSLTTPMQRYPRDLKLVGLMMRDRKVNYK